MLVTLRQWAERHAFSPGGARCTLVDQHGRPVPEIAATGVGGAPWTWTPPASRRLVARRTGDVRAVALVLEGLAVLLGAAAAGRASVGAPLPTAERGDVDRIAAVVEPALGPEAYAAAFDRGRGAGPDGVGP